jgi:SAM-dependent methyltransferase
LAADEWAVRARSFGSVAQTYDRVRPSYPAALVDAVVGRLAGPDVVEVGAGTGKATALFGVRPLRLTCVEPDAAMAGVLKDKCAQLPNVDVTVAAFEEWEPPKPYDGLIAAQSWHWTNPEQRYRKAANVLRGGGLLALFWNNDEWPRTPLTDAIDEVYRRHGYPRHRQSGPPDRHESWPHDELAAQPTFADVEARTYVSTHTYSAQQWCDYMASTSAHLVLDHRRNEALLADLRRAIDREAGGVFEVSRRCDLYLARRTDTPA